MRRSCPIPISDYPSIQLAHGGGGKLMRDLIEKMFLPAFGSADAGAPHDSAVFEIGGKRFAFTTDSYVVQPLTFPGGDIGSLAINGTVNDLAMAGARPLFLSAGFVLEEGLPMETLWQIVQSMKDAAEAAGVALVTGDTKVVDKGKGDGIFINTAGIGLVEHNFRIAPEAVEAGDAIVVSGDIGRHGIAIMAVREGLEFETTIESDCAPVADMVRALLDAGIDVHCLRDLTRGGLASAAVEIAESCKLHISLDESVVPVRDDVHAACELLGFDPMYVANEGRFIAIVPGAEADRVVEILRKQTHGENAVIIGTVADDEEGLVTLKSRIGANRIVDMLSGEQLPRIC